jgi:hypothetical protein
VKRVHLDEIEGRPVGKEGLLWKPLRHTLGVEAFGINAYTAANAGDEVVEHHTEAELQHEEVYVVVAGRATFHVGEEELDAPAGTCVFLDDPAERRGAVAREPGTTVLAIGGRRGHPYEISAWEYTFRAAGEQRAGRDEGARAIMAEGLTKYPDDGGLHYNLACIEANAGDDAAALEHLQRAVELGDRFAEYARDDPDFTRLRSDPRFSAIAGQADTAGADA